MKKEVSYSKNVTFNYSFGRYALKLSLIIGCTFTKKNIFLIFSPPTVWVLKE